MGLDADRRIDEESVEDHLSLKFQVWAPAQLGALQGWRRHMEETRGRHRAGAGGVAWRLFPPQAGHLRLPWRNILGLAFARSEVSQNEGKKGGGVAVLDLICPWL